MHPASHKVRFTNSEIKVVNDIPAVKTPAESPFVQTTIELGRELWQRELVPRGVSYYTDAAILAAKNNIPTIILGPGQDKSAHRVDEYVDLAEVVRAMRFYEKLALKVLC